MLLPMLQLLPLLHSCTVFKDAIAMLYTLLKRSNATGQRDAAYEPAAATKPGQPGHSICSAAGATKAAAAVLHSAALLLQLLRACLMYGSVPGSGAVTLLKVLSLPEV
jgi:hypothetical protein